MINTIKKSANKNYTDVTEKWINASLKKGKVKIAQCYIYNNIKYVVDGKYIILDYTYKEKTVAMWLVKNFGGTLYLLPKINYPQKIKTSDYLFRNQKWDLKSLGEDAISYTRAVDNIIKKSKNQTNNIILDITNTKISRDSIIKQVQKVFSTSGREWVKTIMIIDNYHLLKIYQRK